MATDGVQADLAAYETTTETVSITRTIRCKLETSRRKNDRVREIISEWQSIAATVADFHASFPDYEWGQTKTNPSFYRIVQREHPDSVLHSSGALSAVHKVGEAFQSWRGNGKHGSRPAFGHGDYARFNGDGVELIHNDRGYGLKIKLEPYDPEWWHINSGDYQLEFLDRVENGDGSIGNAELHLDGETLYCHLSISYPVSVYEPAEVSTWLGVDLGERVLFAAAVVSGDEISAVEIESGREYRHYRERLKRKRSALMEKDDLRGVKQCKNEHERYTDHITNVASRRVVDLAVDHEPCGIRVEELTGYRDNATDAIHDFPYAEIREKIVSKATEEGIPVEAVDPAQTSITCRKCGHENPSARDGNEFRCPQCRYEVHADVNAAMNIATR